MRPLLGLALALALALVVTVAAVEPRGGDPGGIASPVETSGPRGPVGPVPRACEGVVVGVDDDLQAQVEARPPGTTFCLAAGVHRLVEPVVPRQGDAFVGELGAVLSGSAVLGGWRKDGRGWSTTARLPARPGDHGECRTTSPYCRLTQDVFRDGRRLERVGSVAGLTSGTVFADYGTNTVTVGDDPRGHLLEQAVAPSLIRGTADDVTVANLVLEQAANEAQTGAVEARRVKPYGFGSGWRLLQNEVRLNHGAGLGLASDTLVAGNYIHHQGQLGFGAWGSRSEVRDNEISYNGVAGYSSEWEAGGSKSWETTGQSVTHNVVHHNRGPGLWTDGGNSDTRYAYNVVDDNWGAGIQHELSYDATIEHNEVARNGSRHKGWAWEAGIQIQSSGGTRLLEVAHNDLVDNANGISLIDSGNRAAEPPSPHGPHLVRNVWVHDNTVTMATGQSTGAVQDDGDHAIFTRNHNRFESNTYFLDSFTQACFSWADRDLTWTQWRALGNGNDLNGRVQLRQR